MNQFDMSGLSPEIARALEFDAPFKNDGPPPTPTTPQQKTAPATAPLIDLRKYFSVGGTRKWTCAFCDHKFTQDEVNAWLRSPDNKRNKPALPVCPACKCGNTIVGWADL